MVQGSDIIVISAGQAGLAVRYYMRRTPYTWVILDVEPRPSGAWRHGWDSLRLFLPAQGTSLAGWPMPSSTDGMPTRDDILVYFAANEARYALSMQRPVRVQVLRRDDDVLLIKSDRDVYQARALISTTGTWAGLRSHVTLDMSCFVASRST